MQQHTHIDKERSLSEMIERCVQQFPEEQALFINEHFYTYAVFWDIVKNIHAQIPERFIYSRIGIYCNNDVYTYAAMVAVNLYGAAYVPLNKKFPVERNQFIVEESGVELILTSVENADLKAISGNIEIINVLHAEAEAPEKNGTGRVNFENKTAYILFTSGSTGVPKGVPVSNNNLHYFFNYYLKNYDFHPRDRFLQVYELTFDVSVFSFFMPLLTGACCYVLPEDGIRFSKIIECLQKHQITVVSMVPTVLSYLENYFSEINLPDLRYSFFSGDALYYVLAVKWSACISNAVIHNFYGPTETTIVCTRYVFNEKLSEEESVNGIVPLGKAFEGMEFLIVDENNHPAQKGELCFAGTQVITGYLNDQYADKFFINNEKIYYKTGDIAALNEHGNLVFYGRTDEQVKINGYRIELKEVQFAIEKCTHATCIVIAEKDKNNWNRLCAFIAKPGLDKEQLLATLSLQLPEYMLPQEVIFVDEIPLSLNGKPDKNKLLNLQK